MAVIYKNYSNTQLGREAAHHEESERISFRSTGYRVVAGGGALAVWTVPVQGADDDADASASGDEGGLVAAADVMKSSQDYHDKQIRVKGSIQRVEQGDAKDAFVIVLDDNLRCKMRKAEVEKKYSKFKTASAGSYYTSKTQIKMMVSKANGSAKLLYTKSFKENSNYVYDNHNNKSQVDVPIFGKGETIEIGGTVKRVSDNRVILDNCSVASYDWPQLDSYIH